jgi:hypothetical protein
MSSATDSKAYWPRSPACQTEEHLPVLFEALKMSRESPGGVERIGEVLAT